MVKNYSTLLAAFLLIGLFQSCTTTSGIPPESFTQASAPPREVLKESLFNDPNATFSEAAIQLLLDGRIELPDSMRIAIYRYGSTSTNRYYRNWWYDEEYLKTQQSYQEALSQKIASVDRVQRLILMPQLMIDQNPNITQLREAAVRLQADLLLVYTINSDIYYKYKAFKKDEAKAFATCEAIFMDIRTGVIPHSSVLTEENFTRKGETDISIQEMRKRAEQEAVIKVLESTGNAVFDFLSGNK